MTPKRRMGRQRRRYRAAAATLLLIAAEFHHSTAFTTSYPVTFRKQWRMHAFASDTSDNAEYDAIVIGSGMSGLVAGNHLAKQGLKVLMVESHSIPGGYTTNFYRKGFRFEVSTHMLNGCDPDGTIGKILNDFDVYDKIEFKQLNSLLRWIDPTRNIDATLPVGIDAYVDQLCSLYPHEEKGIREFHEKYYPLAAWVVEYEQQRGLNKIAYALQNLPILWRLLSLRRKTAADIIDPLIKDPACREILTVMTALFGLHYTELDAAIFVMGSMMFHASGSYYPIGGSGKLSKVLADRFAEYGGELWLRSHVEEIRFDENGVAKGVMMKDKKGNVISKSTKCVINCSDLSTLVNKLCPEGTLQDNFVNKVRKHVPGNSLVVAWAGLDIDLKDRGVKDFEIIRTNNLSEEMRGTKRLKEIMQSADYSNLPVSGATIYSNIDPTCCSPGKSLIATNFMASHDTFAQMLDSDGGRGVRYHELKDKVEKQLLDVMVDATGMADLADHIEVVEVGTPITFERYTENLGGSFMGWRNTPRQGAFSSFSPRTPIPNLFQCGQWLGVGGVASVMTTGLDAAKMATRYLDRLDKESKLETTDTMATDSPASGSIGVVSFT